MHQCVADNDVLAVLVASNPRASYCDFLVRRYGLEAPLHSAFALVSEVSGWIDVASHHRVAQLAKDLEALGLADQMLEMPCARVGVFRKTAEALGWFYVLQSNTSSFQILQRHLPLRAPTVAHAMAYLSTYTVHNPRIPSVLARAFDAVVGTSQEAFDEVIAAAMAAYECQHHWLRPDVPSATVLCSAGKLMTEVA